MQSLFGSSIKKWTTWREKEASREEWDDMSSLQKTDQAQSKEFQSNDYLIIAYLRSEQSKLKKEIKTVRKLEVILE